MDKIKIGIIGLDTSHVVAFTELLNNENALHHVAGGTVTYAYIGGSPNSNLSMSRIKRFTNSIKNDYDIEIIDSLKQLAEKSDAILLESVDGGQHLEQIKEIIAYKKPIFIDKPFALSIEDTEKIISLAKMYDTPIMSSSALRFAEGLSRSLERIDLGGIIGADCFGPMEIIEEQPGYFWYGIHTIEMLFTILGEGSVTISVVTSPDHDLITAVWGDGKIGTVRGNRLGNNEFGAAIHFEGGTEFVNIAKDDKPFYASILEQVMLFFEDGITRVPLTETTEVIRFIEAANQSRLTGEIVKR